jgi:hypothetical protein
MKEKRYKILQKNKVGKPLKFKTVAILQKKIDEYFRKCDEHKAPYVIKGGEVIMIPDPIPYTITGLAEELDTSREGLINYQNRDEYFDAIRRAKLKCERFAEESLWKPKVASGVIFNLKNNYGWKEKNEVDITTQGDKITDNEELEELSRKFNEFTKND